MPFRLWSLLALYALVLVASLAGHAPEPDGASLAFLSFLSPIISTVGKVVGGVVGGITGAQSGAASATQTVNATLAKETTQLNELQALGTATASSVVDSAVLARIRELANTGITQSVRNLAAQLIASAEARVREAEARQRRFVLMIFGGALAVVFVASARK